MSSFINELKSKVNDLENRLTIDELLLLEDVKQYAKEVICFYSDNDPYVKYEIEKDFADKIATEQVLISNGGHINSENGYDILEEIVNYI